MMDLEPCFIDIETFIQEIENRPALWDVDHPDYRCKSAKKACWEELAEMFGDCDNIERLRLLGSVLQKKWKNLRDNYAKELKKQKLGITDSDGKRHVPYVYFERLSFLDKSVSTRGGTSNNFPELYDQDETTADATEVQVQYQDTSSQSSPGRPTISRPVRVFKQVKVSERAQPYFSDPVFVKNKGEAREKTREPDQDGDKHFCLGLYKELKKVAEHARMKTKIELMEVIQRAQMEGSDPRRTTTPTKTAVYAAPPTRTVTRYLVNYPPQKPGSSPVAPKIMPITPGAPVPKLPLPKLSSNKGASTTTAPQTITLIIPDQTFAASPTLPKKDVPKDSATAVTKS